MKYITAVLLAVALTSQAQSDAARKPVHVREAAVAEIFGRKITLYLSDSDNLAFAKIENGDTTDEVWINRSNNDEKSHEEDTRLGHRVIPVEERSVTTDYFSVEGNFRPGHIGSVRACGKAGNRDNVVCTDWQTRRPEVCGKVCDGEPSTSAANPSATSTVEIWARKITLFISNDDEVAFAKIENGAPTDEVWLDRSKDDGKSWADGSRLGYSSIPAGTRQVTTGLINLDGGSLRACGKAGNQGDINCTGWTKWAAPNEDKPALQNQIICARFCDGAELENADNFRASASAEIYKRLITLFVSNADNVAFARIERGDPSDEVWMDRSWDGGKTWQDGSRLGYSNIPPEQGFVNTKLFHVDYVRTGFFRACGKAGDRPEIVCTSWKSLGREICNKLCDGDSTDEAVKPREAATATIYSRVIALYVSDTDDVAFAKIENGDPTDEVWMDRSWDEGRTVDDGSRLGYTAIPPSSHQVTTNVYNLNGPPRDELRGSVRACGKAGNREEIACTEWTKSSTVPKKNKKKFGSRSGKLCSKFCDGDSTDQATNLRLASAAKVHTRKISVFVSDLDNVAFAKISNGDPGDVVWLDRSWNGGRTWIDGGRLGKSLIPFGLRQVTTGLYNVDGSFENRQIGSLRACGKSGARDGIVCTDWVRSTAHAGSPAEAGVTALMMDYGSSGLWDTTGWWNAANCLTTVIDYMNVTNDRTYEYAIENTHEKNKEQFEGNFCNEYLDDTGWWGLAWVRAYDLTGDQKYLDTAKTTADFMQSHIDSKCGGGVYWSNAKKYKNAITNELFIKLTAAIHNRIHDEPKYLNWAIENWNWFENSGMINDENLINDGLNSNCLNNGEVTWTNSQGVILGGFVELFKATGDETYLDKARKIADAATRSSYLHPSGILREPCDMMGNDCGADGPSFKGVFARNLGELNASLEDRPYSAYLTHNADTLYNHRNLINQYGLHYEGPYEFHSSASQQSAVDMLIAAGR